MQNNIANAIATLVSTLGFRGEEFYTSPDEWALSSIIFKESVPAYRFRLMEHLAADLKLGENKVTVITKEGIIVDNEETEDVMFLPYDCLSSEVLKKIVGFITLATDTQENE